MSFPRILHLILIGLFPALLVAATKTAWQDWARRFTGESDAIRAQALRNLRQTPHLRSELRKALDGPDRLLAMEVIATLPMPSLLNELLEIAKRDATGISIVSINALINPKNEKKIIPFYKNLLANPQTPFSTKVAILDTLARLRVSISESLLASFIRNERFPEIQSAALDYLMGTRSLWPRRWVLELHEDALHSSFYQIRQQAFFHFQTLQPLPPLLLARLTKRCQKDPSSAVKKLCAPILSKRRIG